MSRNTAEAFKRSTFLLQFVALVLEILHGKRDQLRSRFSFAAHFKPFCMKCYLLVRGKVFLFKIPCCFPFGTLYVFGDINVVTLNTNTMLIVSAVLLPLNILLFFVSRSIFRRDQILTDGSKVAREKRGASKFKSDTFLTDFC